MTIIYDVNIIPLSLLSSGVAVRGIQKLISKI